MQATRLLVALACSAVLAGCGSDDAAQQQSSEAEPDADLAVGITGTDQLLWRPTQLTVPTGSTQVRVECGPELGHEFAIDDVDGGNPVATCEPAGTGAGTVDLEAGSYTFFCAVPGHREEGMEGELVVE